MIAQIVVVNGILVRETGAFVRVFRDGIIVSFYVEAASWAADVGAVVAFAIKVGF